MTTYWQKWLAAWAIAVIFFGLVLACGAFGATDGLTNLFFAVLRNPLPSDVDAHHRFAIGLIGAVTMGWGLTFWGAFKALHKLEPVQAAPIWRWLLSSLLVWYVIDSAISVATGFWINAVSNTVFVILFMIPLIRSSVMKG